MKAEMRMETLEMLRRELPEDFLKTSGIGLFFDQMSEEALDFWMNRWDEEGWIKADAFESLICHSGSRLGKGAFLAYVFPTYPLDYRVWDYDHREDEGTNLTRLVWYFLDKVFGLSDQELLRAALAGNYIQGQAWKTYCERTGTREETASIEVSAGQEMLRRGLHAEADLKTMLLLDELSPAAGNILGGT